MTFASLAFYLFAALTISASFMVIATRTPVHSVPYPILAFFHPPAQFSLIGAAFFALPLVLLSVPSVAVCFPRL